MKKATLLSRLLCLLAIQIFAQKGVSIEMKQRLVARAKASVQQQIKASTEGNLSRSAAYLLDSTRLVFNIDPDTLILEYSKFQYLPDGKIKSTELYFDAIFFSFGVKTVSTWNLARARVVRNDMYIKSSIDEPFSISGVDSLFYDTKGKNNIIRNYSIAQNGKLALTGWKLLNYKSNYVIADSIKTYELDGTNLTQTKLEYNKFDAKGNVVEHYILDLIDVIGAGERTTYIYDNKNNLKEALYSDNLQNGKWINTSLDFYNYNTKNLATEHYVYTKWNNEKKAWGDSSLTRTVFNSFNKPLSSDDLKIDSLSKKWTIELTTENFYDKNNHESIDKIYGFEAGIKTLVATNRYWWSLYKDAISTKDILPKGYDLTFANPIENGKNITVIAPNNERLNLDIFDSLGRLFFSQQVENQQVITININTTGHFIAVLSNLNARVLAIKKVVKF